MSKLFTKQMKEDRDFWMNKVPEEINSTNLMLDFKRPNLYVDKRSSHHIKIPDTIYTKIKRLSKNSPFLNYVILMTSLKICLYKYTNDSQIIVGSPIQKKQGTLEKTNVIPIIDNINDQFTLQESLIQIRGTLIEAYQRQNYPFEQLIRDVGIEKRDNRCPLFDIILSYSEIHDTIPNFKNDITLNFYNKDSNLYGEIEYNSSLFTSDTIERFSQHYLKVLSYLVDSNKLCVGEVDILTEEERHKVLFEWNQTTADFPLDQTFKDLFEKQVTENSDEIAVIYKGESWTYHDLNAKANRIARELVEKNVGPGSIVPLLAERSVWFLIAMIAIYKAGGAYLPIDPKHPIERIRKVIKQSSSNIVLVTKEFVTKMEESIDGIADERPLICELEIILKRQHNETNLPTITDPNNLAYVLFTSGSTGEPKGILIEQIGMINHLFLKIQDFNMSNHDIVAHTAPQCFDISIWQFLSALLVGGKVHIFTDEVSRDPISLFQEVDSNGVTLAQIVPSLLRAFLNSIEDGDLIKPKLSRLQWLCVTGEALPPDVARKWFAHYPQIPLMNAYGPTECSDDVTMYPIYQSPSDDIINMPIGKVSPNLKAYVLDKNLRPVPLGVIGEIYIGGVGVGRGYLNNPEKTKAAFISNPFVDEPSARMYKTGDLGRFLNDGTLEYFGRVDFQVKVRGHRIELGEIDAVLRKHPKVRDVAILARDDIGKNQQLVAYVVVENHESLSETELRELLKKYLPDYMVPSIIVFINELPLTSNGKLDRKALPIPNEVQNDNKHLCVEPRNQIEKVLAKVWAEVLNLDFVGIQSNFFELGGDSILSIQVAYKCKHAGVFIRPTQILEHPTIEKLSQVVSKAEIIEADQDLVSGDSPLTPIQSWFFEEQYVDSHHWNQAVMLQSREHLLPNILEKTVKTLLEHHDVLRSQFKTTNGGIVHQFNSNYTSIPFKSIDLSEVNDDQQITTMERIAANTQMNLNLFEGPLIQIVLFNLGENKTERLLIVMHHLITDGVSWRILIEDLQHVYQSLRRGESPNLLAKTTSYKKWSEKLIDYAKSKQVTESIDYWLALSEVQNDIIPKDIEGRTNKVDSASIVTEGLTLEETNIVLHEAANHNFQLNDVILTALLKTLCQWTGQTSILLNLEGHGREDIFGDVDVSRTIGWFTSEFPVMLNLSSETSVNKEMKHIQEQLKEIPQNGFNYGLLRYLHPDQNIEKRFSSLPKPKISFNYLGHLNQSYTGDSMFSPATESVGPLRSLLGKRSYLLEINCAVIDGRLKFNWEYSENVHNQSTIQELAHNLIKNILDIKDDLRINKLDEELTDTDESINVSSKVNQSIPLTHMQQWFFSQQFVDQHHWNTAILLKPIRALDKNVLHSAVSHVISYHDTFKLTYNLTENGWVQTYSDTLFTDAFEYIDFSDLHDKSKKNAVEEVVSDFQSKFDLTTGPLIRVVLFNLGNNEQRIFIVVHHLVIDHLSWNFLLEDIQSAYFDLEQGLVPRLAPRTSTYQFWAKRLSNYAQTYQPQSKFQNWMAHQQIASVNLPKDYTDTQNTEQSLAEFHLEFSVEETESLIYVVRNLYKMNIGDVLLTALAMTLTKWTGSNSILIDQGIHGRKDLFDDVDVSRTIGWFTTSVPTSLQILQGRSIEEILLINKLRLEESRQYGFDYAVLRSISQNPTLKSISRIETPKVAFDYDGSALGTSGAEGEITPSFWSIAEESRGLVRSPEATRSYEFDIRSWTYDKKIMVNWQYSKALYKKSTIEYLSKMYKESIRDIIKYAKENTN